MTYKINDMQGIGPEFTKRLAAMNLHTTDDLLKFAETDSGFKTLAEKTGASDTVIRKWVTMADLMRVKGVNPQYAELLEGIGVDSPQALRIHKPEDLVTRLTNLNATRRLSGAVPTMDDVRTWMDSAKEFQPASVR